MKVLLFYGNSRSIQTNSIQWAPPYGLTCLASVLTRDGHEVRLFDPSFSDSIDSDVWHYVNEYKPDAIGVSIRNIGGDSYPWVGFYSHVIEIIESIKKAHKGLIVLGGAAFTLYPEKFLQATGLKYGIIGEGEKSFSELLKYIERGAEPPDDMPGLAVNRDGNVRRNPLAHLPSLEELPAPAFELIDYEKYMRRNCGASIQTKRGCAYECIYCDYPTFEGARYRLIPAGEVVERMARMKAAGVNRFFIVDSVFSYPAEHAINVCEEIARRGLKVKWSAYVNPRGATRELADAMKRAGCARMDVTIDAASEKMLANMRKGFSVADILKFDEVVHGAGVPTFYQVQLGAVGEDERTIQETFSVLGSLHISAGFIGLGFRIYPGTALEQMAREEGMKIEHDPANLPSYISKAMPADLDKRVMDFVAPRPHWCTYLDGASKVRKVFDAVVEAFGGDPLNYFWLYGHYRKLKRRLFHKM